MKKVFTALFAAMAVMFAFSSCVVEDAGDDTKYTYTYNTDWLYANEVEKFYFEIFDADTYSYAGKINRNLYYFKNSGNNTFDETLAVLKRVSDSFTILDGCTTKEQWIDVQTEWANDSAFMISSTEALDIKEICKESYNKEMLLFVKPDDFETFKMYKVLYFTMNKK